MRTQTAAIIAAGLTILVALLLTPLFAPLPDTVLGAIVIVAVFDMVGIPAFRRLLRISRGDFALAATALMGVLVLDVLPRLLLAFGHRLDR